MYSNEILFADKFLAKLTIMGIFSIPFKTSEYRAGIRAMKTYYEAHMDELDEGMEDIGLLFIGNGEKDFANAIMAVNGDDISLKNPNLERATIQMTTTRAQMSVEDEELAIPDVFMTEITQAFCDAAHVEA